MPTDRVDEIMGEWREEAERGRHIDPEALLESHPEHAEELADRFAAQALVDHYYAEADSLPLITPERIGDYRIVGEIGRGGMGVVYEAVQESMERRVALKVLYPTIATTVRTMKRFEREARVTGKLHHTNIVTVYAMGRDAGYVYFAMELIEGQPLDKMIVQLGAQERGEPTSVPMQRLASDMCGRGRFERLARKLAGVADALHVAHAHGVVHRDVKPSNLVLDGDGDLKLTDFGLAQLVGEDFGVTRTGEVLGTPLYMSPEQVRAQREEVDQRTDVYSLGATLYELLALTPPHGGRDVGSLCAQILTEEPRPLRSVTPEVPKDLATIVHKALQKERGDRYASAGRMAADLRAFAEGRPISARPLGVAQRSWRMIKRHRVRSALVGLVLIASATAVYMTSRSREEEARRIALQYAGLIKKADETAGFAIGPSASAHAELLYAEAIALRPERPDAWFARALALNRSTEERLADIAEAEARGMSPRAVHLARAFVYRSVPRVEEAQAEEMLAGDAQGGAPVEQFLEGLIAKQSGNQKRAMEIFEALLDQGALPARLRQQTLLRLAKIHDQAGQYELAMEHLSKAYVANRLPIPVAVHIAALWRKLDKAEMAERRFQSILDQMRPEDPVFLWDALCETSERFATSEWIRRAAEAGLRYHPDAPGLHYYRALGLWGEQRREEALAVCTKALESWGDYHMLHAIHGKLLLGQGKNEEAVEAFQEAIRLMPNMAGPRFDLAMAMLSLRKLDEAVRVCHEGLALDPAYSFGYEVEARIHRHRGDLAAAIVALRHCLEILPRGVRPRRALADALEHAGKRDDALAVLADGIRRLPSELQMRLDRIHMLGRAGQGEARRIDAEAFLKSIRELLKLTPNDAALHRRRALAFNLLNRNEEAVSAFDDSIRLGGDKAETWHDRGLILIELSRLKEAQASIEKAVALSPTFAAALSSLGDVLSKQGKYEQALDAIQRSLANARESWLVAVNRYNLARTLKFLARFEEAEEAYKEAIRATPRDGDCWAGLANLYLQQGELAKAVGTFDKAVEIAPHSIGAWFGAVDARGRQGKTEEALGTLAKGLGIHPDNSYLLSQRGVLLREAERLEEAKAAYAPYLKEGPTWFWAWSGMATVLSALEEHEAAVAHYDKALALNPGNMGTLYNRAMALGAMGRHREALADLESALKAPPGHPVYPVIQGGAAWFLVACKDRTLRDPARALELAAAAARTAPGAAVAWTALGWARLHERKEPETAISALQEAVSLQPPGEEDLGAYLGLAIAHARRGDRRAVEAWMQKAHAYIAAHRKDAKDYAHLYAETKAELDTLEPPGSGR